MLASYLIQHKDVSPEDLVVIEAGRHAGGLYNPWISHKLGPLDKGMHIYYETGIKAIDDIVYNSLLPEEWIVLEGNRKDIAGAFFQNRIQENTPYPDLRAVDHSRKSLYIGDILQQLEKAALTKEPLRTSGTCCEYWEQRFGEALTHNVYNSIAEKLYGHPCTDLDESAAYITKLDRVCLLDAWTIRRMDSFPEARKVLAYPDQLTMPDYRKNNQRGLYPREGMRHLLASMTEKLLGQGVRILYNTSVECLSLIKGQETLDGSSSYKIKCAQVTSDRRTPLSLEASFIVWTGSSDLLPKLFEANKSNHLNARSSLADKITIDNGATCFTYFKVGKGQHNLGSLYYAYFYDINTLPFRLTNLSSYSSSQGNEDSHDILCAEYHLTDTQVATLSANPLVNLDDFMRCALDELVELGLINQVPESHYDGFALPYRLFPVPLRHQFHAKKHGDYQLANIIYNGKNKSRPDFFLVDILTSFHVQLDA